VRVLTPLGIFALALAVRLLPWPTVIEKDRVVFFGMDAWYHMRRVQIALVTTGWPPAFDPYDNFPDGALPIWSPLFDALLALVLWPIHALASWLAVERAAAIVPPVIGALCVVATYRLALRLFDACVATVAGVLLSLLSAHFWYSQVGFVDHHVAVALLSTLLLGSAASFLGVLSGSAPVRELRGRALAFGALAALALLLWPGMLLELALAELALGVLWVRLDERSAAIRGAAALALANALALVLVLPSGWTAEWVVWSEFSPAVLSRFQPWLFAVLAMLAAACGLLWSRTTSGRTRARRTLQVAGVGLVLLVGSVALFPDLVAGFGEGWRWFLKDEAFQALVMESKPLFVSEAGFDPTIAEVRLTRLFYLLPVLLAALAWHARSSAQAPALLLLAGWTLVFAAATLLQRRFFNSLAPPFALVIAWSLVALLRRIVEHTRDRRAWRAAVAAVALAVFAWLYSPTLRPYRIPLRYLAAAWRGVPMTAPESEIARRVLIDTAEWLRDNTPPTAGPLDPAARPEYGVMASWGIGHLIKYVALRPTVVGNFGDDVGEANMRRSSAYFGSGEPDAVRILDDLRARYVVATTLGAVSPEQLQGEAMLIRMSIDDSPGWRHHRLLYESRLEGERAAIGRSEFRIFERVAGARLVGTAAAGARVVAQLRYRSNRGRQGAFQSSVAADAEGRYELRLPYATRGAPPGVQPDASYQIRSGSRSERVAIDERDVQSGAIVAGPDLAHVEDTGTR
jgi:dolichyl-diphosphooligosaccharide--protein glycosyltransferase